MGDLDGMSWYVDPIAACLLGVFCVAIVVLLSTAGLRIHIRKAGSRHDDDTHRGRDHDDRRPE